MDNTDNELTSDNSDSVEEDKKTSKKITKFEISAELKEKLKDLPDVLEYITRLHKYLEKQKRKIRKLKRLKVSLLLARFTDFFPHLTYFQSTQLNVIRL